MQSVPLLVGIEVVVVGRCLSFLVRKSETLAGSTPYFSTARAQTTIPVGMDEHPQAVLSVPAICSPAQRPTITQEPSSMRLADNIRLDEEQPVVDGHIVHSGNPAAKAIGSHDQRNTNRLLVARSSA